jgi:hypothetical protein
VSKNPRNEFNELADAAFAPDDPPTENLINPNEFTRSRNDAEGFFVMPRWVLKEIVRARAHHHTIPLVLAILRHARLRRTKTVPITSTIWAEAGSPGERERKTILRHLRDIPGVLRLENRHQGYTRYQATLGDMWES